MVTPSFHTVSQPVQTMIRLAITNASGDRIPAAGSRYGRSASGSRRRKAPSERGPPPYISTEALVIRPTSDCQDGNGRKQMHPVTNAATRPTHGTPRALVHSNTDGT